MSASGFARVELRQIWLAPMNQADRCISCHVAIEDASFEKGINPLKAHPENYLEKHNPEKYGCTICHDGQGRAVNFKDAVADGPDIFWNKPILRKPFLEANCYRCHVDLLNQTPGYNQGKQKFQTSGCLGCHQLEGNGGYRGPELSGIGDASAHSKYPDQAFDSNLLSEFNNNKNLAYIYEAVRFPDVQPEETIMFDFKLSHRQALALTIYLKSLVAHQIGTQLLLPKPVYKLQIAEKGKKIFGAYCTACHGNNGIGSVRNPNSINDYIPKLNVLSEQMFLYKKENRDMVISILIQSGDLMQESPQSGTPGFFKVIAKYMAVKNIIINGRIVKKKNPEDAEPLNMPSWIEVIPEEDISSIIAYLISIY